VFFLAAELKDERWEILIAENGPQARLTFYQRRPNVVLLDYMLREDDGLQLGLEFQQQAPLTHVILMTGGGLSDELQAVCEERDFPVLNKPFLALDVLNLVRGLRRIGRLVLSVSQSSDPENVQLLRRGQPTVGCSTRQEC
jgi:DNA-binding NtrC family response regulator